MDIIVKEIKISQIKTGWEEEVIDLALNIQVRIKTQATWLFLSRNVLVNWNLLLGKSRIGFNRRVWLAYPLSKNEWVLQETFHHNHNPEINIFNLTIWNINGIHLKDILHRPELFFRKTRGQFHGALIKTKNFHYFGLSPLIEDVASNQTIAGGYFGAVFDQVQATLNFTVQRVFGYPSEDTNDLEMEGLDCFTSVIEMVSNATINYSWPIYAYTAYIWIRQPNDDDFGWIQNLVKPFSLNLWSAMIGISIIFIVSSKFFGFQLYDSIFVIYASLFCLVGLPDFSIRKRFSGRFLMNLISLLGLVLMTAYNANLLAKMTSKKTNLPFTTWKEFNSNGRYQLGVLRHTGIYRNLITREDPEINKIITTFMLSNPANYPFDEKPIAERICNVRFAFIEAEVYLPKEMLHCSLVRIPINVQRLYAAWAFTKDNPYFLPINTL